MEILAEHSSIGHNKKIIKQLFKIISTRPGLVDYRKSPQKQKAMKAMRAFLYFYQLNETKKERLIE